MSDEVLYCADVEKLVGKFSCCDSCHQDEEYGFDLLEVGVHDAEGKPRVAMVCCEGSRAVDGS